MPLQLVPRQRAVLTLRDMEGLSIKEVCGILKMKSNNVRVLLHRARIKINNALTEYQQCHKDLIICCPA